MLENLFLGIWSLWVALIGTSIAGPVAVVLLIAHVCITYINVLIIAFLTAMYIDSKHGRSNDSIYY